MSRRKYGNDKFFQKISHTATSGVVGDAEYQVKGENNLRAVSTFASSGTLTIQGRIEGSDTWDNLGTLVSGGDSDTFDIATYDFVRFNFTVAAGSSGEIAASGFFNGSSAGSGGASTAFTIIQPDAGTSPTADSATDTLTLTSSDASITITGNSTTDTVDFVVATTPPSALDDLSDVSITTPSNGEALVYNSTSGEWENQSVGGGGGGDVTGPASSVDNAIVRFNGTTGKIIQDYTSGAPTVSDTGAMEIPVSVSKPDATYPASQSFGPNNTVNGTLSFSAGDGTTVAERCVSVGIGALNSGNRGVSIGNASNVVGQFGNAIGWASSANQRAVGLGYIANANATSAIAIGYLARADVQNGTSIGQSSRAAAVSGFALGSGAQVTSNGTSGAIAIGSNAQVDAFAGLAIGSDSDVTSTGGAGMAIGKLAQCSGDNAIALGYWADAAHTQSMCIGSFSNTTANNQFVLGDQSWAINNIYLGEGVTSTSPQALTMSASGANGTDLAAGDFTIRAGAGTGTGAGGHLKFETAEAGTTGSTLNGYTTHIEITDDGNVIMANLPTSSAGLPTGALWNNSGVLNIA